MCAAVLGLIDVALTGVIGSSDAPPLIVSLGVAALGLITLLALVPARRWPAAGRLAVPVALSSVSLGCEVPGGSWARAEIEDLLVNWADDDALGRHELWWTRRRLGKRLFTGMR